MNSLTLGRKLHVMILMLCACALAVVAQGGAPAADEAAIREPVKQLEAGWNTKSGADFARPFAEDADYVVINGMYLRGRAAIAEAHQRIFDTIYKETSISLSVRQLRFLRPDVAVVHVDGTRRGPGPAASKAVLTLVMVKEAGAWQIAAFQNTQVAR